MNHPTLKASQNLSSMNPSGLEDVVVRVVVFGLAVLAPQNIIKPLSQADLLVIEGQLCRHTSPACH